MLQLSDMIFIAMTAIWLGLSFIIGCGFLGRSLGLGIVDALRELYKQ